MSICSRWRAAAIGVLGGAAIAVLLHCGPPDTCVRISDCAPGLTCVEGACTAGTPSEVDIEGGSLEASGAGNVDAAPPTADAGSSPPPVVDAGDTADASDDAEGTAEDDAGEPPPSGL